jgi:hypothetical protein
MIPEPPDDTQSPKVLPFRRPPGPPPGLTYVTVELLPEEATRLDVLQAHAEVLWGLDIRSREEVLVLLMHLASDHLFGHDPLGTTLGEPPAGGAS